MERKFFSHFFVFSHFDAGIWTWIAFDFMIRIWWTLVSDTFGMVPKNDVGFDKFNPSHWWHHHLVLSWYWKSDLKITLDLVFQFWWNFETFSMIRHFSHVIKSGIFKDLISEKKNRSQLSPHFPEKPFQAPKIIFSSSKLTG